MADASAPIRKQYLGIKRRYPRAIVLFRIGDFYETFDDDAKLVSRELDIVLTSKEMGKGHRVPLAGIPYHSLDTHLARLSITGIRWPSASRQRYPAPPAAWWSGRWFG